MKNSFFLFLIIVPFSFNAQDIALTLRGDTVMISNDSCWVIHENFKKQFDLYQIIKNDSIVFLSSNFYKKIGYSINSEGLFASIVKDDDKIILNIRFQPKEIVCYKQFSSKLIITLENGDRIKCSLISNPRCNSNKILTFIPVETKNDEDNLNIHGLSANIDKLTKNKWKKMQLITSNSIFFINPINEINKSFFIDHILRPKRE